MPIPSRHQSNPISHSSSRLFACSQMKLSGMSLSVKHAYMRSLSIPTITIGWWPRLSLIREAQFILVVCLLTFNFSLQRTSPQIITTQSRILPGISSLKSMDFKLSHVMRTRWRHTSCLTRWIFTSLNGKTLRYVSSSSTIGGLLFTT